MQVNMAQRPQSHDEQYPEVVPNSHHNVYDTSYEYFLPQTSPAPEYIPPQRSPAPSYPGYGSPNLSSPSPRFSTGSPPPLGSSLGHSPNTSDAGWKGRTSVKQFSEFQSPDPEMVHAPAPAPVVSHVPTEKEYYKHNADVKVVPTATEYQVHRKPLPNQSTLR